MILAFTGAGISVASGIETFQSNPSIRGKLTRDFANYHPEEYRDLMRRWVMSMQNKLPNDAHYALAQYNIPVITMNVDGLHQKAKELARSSQEILPLHGRLPRVNELEYYDLLCDAPILYGDLAPNYSKAFIKVERLRPGDIFLIIGASDYTNIAVQLRIMAMEQGARIVTINKDAEHAVRDFLKIWG